MSIDNELTDGSSSPMDAHTAQSVRTEPRQMPPRVVDLRRTRTPEIEIVACSTYDFLLSLQVALASPEYDYADYDVGRAWVTSAHARCNQADPTALATLDRYLGHSLPNSLHATLISLIAECPAPRETTQFLTWLAEIPIAQFIQVLLDHEGQGADWQEMLAAVLAKTTKGHQAPEALLEKLLACFASDVRAIVAATVRAPEATRHELLAALHVWESAVFAEERRKTAPYIEREATLLEKQRAEMPVERFIKVAMRGVEWRGQVSFRRILFAPSYFCRPAVHFHEWHGTLTFCIPVETAILEERTRANDPTAPSGEILQFFLTLGDKTRLRILRLLTERDMYLTELAERLGLTKATTKHHMVMLRANGFVILYERDRMTYYALRPDIARQATQLISAYLGQAK